MGKIVGGVDTPAVSGAVVRRVTDAVEGWIAHVYVGRGHINLGAQDMRPVRELARPHPGQQIEVLFNRTRSVRTVFTRLGQSAPIATDVVGAQAIHVSLTL